nr:Uma2 family endonuclease [Moorella sp. Hama-1]
MGVVITAPFDVVLARDTVLQPDIVYLARENYHRLTNACLQGAPDLVIEVISPSTIRRDRIRKSRLYLKHSVKEYWLVDPEGGTVEIFTNTPEGWRLAGTYSQEEILNSPLLPGLAIDLTAVFTYPKGLSTSN